MIGGRTRFSPAELPIEGGRVTASGIAASMAVAHELDIFVAAETPGPSTGFTSRVMTAVSAEPAPQPVAVFVGALAGGRLATMLGALRDAWRVSTSGGRPSAVRAQAFALVLLALLTLGSLAGIAGAAVGLFDSRPPSPPPSPTLPAIVAPAPSLLRADEMPSATPAPTASPKPVATAGPTARPTLRPAATPRRTGTPEPTETDDGVGGGDDGRDADDSPSPSDTSGSGGGG